MAADAFIPQLSLEERDRRYRKVREAMVQHGIDCLLLPANSGRWEQLRADSRYLTSIGGFATEVFTVFPLKGEVTAYVFNRAGWWKRAQLWIGDVRDGHNHWAENAIKRMRELGFTNGTIGISGLSGLFHAPDGIIPHTTVKCLQEAFPQARIVNATEMMQKIRAVKSVEEISLLEGSAAVIEWMIERMTETARAGATEKELYASMIHTMLWNGGELPTLFFLGTGPAVTNSSFIPTNRVLQKGDRVVNEVETKFGGYAAQAVSPLILGKPSSDYQAMIDLSRQCFEAVLSRMHPSVAFGTLFDTYAETVQRHGKGKYSWSHPMMHARGLGDDGPTLLDNKDVERFKRIELQAGMVFILKPQVRSAEAKDRASVGDTVVVTENGARRLGKRQLQLIVKD